MTSSPDFLDFLFNILLSRYAMAASPIITAAMLLLLIGRRKRLSAWQKIAAGIILSLSALHLLFIIWLAGMFG